MLKIDYEIQSVQKVDSFEHNVVRVNSIKKKYPEWRKESKAPTFCFDLSRDVYNSDGQLWIFQDTGSTRRNQIP
jgi:hypothetical protein